MYAPPPNEVLAKLVGSTVDLVSFGEYVLHLSFDSGDKLSAASPIRFDSSDRFHESPILEFPLLTSSIPRVVGKVVQVADAEADGTLRLDFSSGDRLVAYASEPGYEAYTLLIGGKEYVV